MDWINDPSDNKDSVSLTVAIVGFIFTMIFATACLVASWITGKPEYLSNLALIITSLLGPTLASFSMNRFTRAKFNNNTTPSTKVTTEDEEA